MFTLNYYISLLIYGYDGITDHKIATCSPDSVMIFGRVPRLKETVLGKNWPNHLKLSPVPIQLRHPPLRL